MRVSEVLRRKGTTVITIAPDRSVREMLALLAEHGIGAVVVTADGAKLDGVVSERDVVRALDTNGDGVLDGPVSAIMTAEVETCGPDAAVEELMVVMTERRVRHVPVLDAGRMVGIVSIGDVVKQRLSEISDERDQLSAYITGSYIPGRGASV